MLLKNEREQVVEVSLQMLEENLTVGTSGNVSVRKDDLVAITPSGVDYRACAPESVCVIDLDGNVVDGDLRPSTEVPMHTTVYQEMDVQAVVHTHPLYASTISVTMDELPAIHYMVALLGGPVRVAPYAIYGSEELARNSVTGMAGGHTAVILQNHGATTVGDSLAQAYTRSQYLEWMCQMYYQARLLGSPNLLSAAEIDRVTDKLRSYGQAS
ncbi:MAG: class II aldolase/adducin family protein [Streptosporangiales bacterium]|nr:class II aldolase/adducin family protein [Streptosporangiales bacterium]